MMINTTITKKEFTSILIHFKYKIEKDEFDYYYRFLRCAELSRQEVFDIFNGANKKVILTEESKKYTKAKISNIMNDIINHVDIELYTKLSEIDQIFKTYAKKHNIPLTHLTATLRQAWDVVKKTNSKLNAGLVDMAQEDLAKLEKMAILYNVIAENVPDGKVTAKARKSENGKIVTRKQEFERIEDFFIGQRLSNLTATSIEKILLNISDVEEFFKTITSENLPENERFSKAEIKDMLDDATTILTSASATKYNAISDVLNEYYSFLRTQAQTSNDLQQIQATQDLTVKEFIKKISSIVGSSETSFKFSVELFQGKKIQDIVTGIMSTEEDDGKRFRYMKKLVEAYPDLQFQPMSIATHLHMLKKSPSDYMKLTAASLLKSTDVIVDSLIIGLDLDTGLSREEKVKLLATHGIDINKFYNADNIHEVIAWGNAFGRGSNFCLENHIKVFSKYVKNEKDIFTIMSHNFSLFRINISTLEDDLRKLEERSGGSAKKFKELFNAYVNTRKIITYSSTTLESEFRLPDEQSDKLEIEQEIDNVEVETSFGTDVEEIIEEPETKVEESEDKIEEPNTVPYQEKFDKICDLLWNLAEKIEFAKDPNKSTRKHADSKKDFIIAGERRRLIKETMQLLKEVINAPEFNDNDRISLQQALTKAQSDLRVKIDIKDEDVVYLQLLISEQFNLEQDKEKKLDRSEDLEKLKKDIKSSRLIGRTLGNEQIQAIETAIDEQEESNELFREKRKETWGSPETADKIAEDGLIHLYAEEIKTKKSLDSAHAALSEIDLTPTEPKTEEKVEVVAIEVDETSLRNELDYWHQREAMKRAEIQRVYGSALKGKGSNFREDKNINYIKLKGELSDIEAKIKEIEELLSACNAQ